MISKGFSKACLCAVICFACLSAGCKDFSEAPLSDSGTSSTASVTYDDTSKIGSVSYSKPEDSSSAVSHVHDRKLAETVAATCDTDGFNLFVCECGDEYKTVISAAGHHYAESTTPADCEHDGFTRYICSDCGDSYDETSRENKALGHSWGDWNVTKAATASADGERRSVCSRCGQTRTESIPKTGASTSSDSFVSEVIRLVNIEREYEGLSPLKESAVLDEYAQLRSTEIVSNFAHKRPDGSSPLTYVMGLSGIHTSGENIANGFSTPEAVVEGWMNSPGHRSNILNPNYTMIGVGCYKSGNKYYWTQIFGG